MCGRGQVEGRRKLFGIGGLQPPGYVYNGGMSNTRGRGNMETNTETFERWVGQQSIRLPWMDEFLARELDGDETRLVHVTRLVTPFGTFTRGLEAA